MYISPGVVVGFHGCDESVFDKVIKNGEALSNSEKAYDWLGPGKYFWEGNFSRALDWAKKRVNVNKPAVIGAFIKLGNCIDLLDLESANLVRKAYEILKMECEVLGEQLPENIRLKDDITLLRNLDCKVIQRLHKITEDEIIKTLRLKSNKGDNNLSKIQTHSLFIDTLRGMFPEGKELYEGAGFREESHIQICVRNPNAIIGYFNPISPVSNFKKI